MKKRKLIVILFTLICFSSSLFFGCNMQTVAKKDRYKGRVFYEIFVRAFNDSNGDGIGDLKGVTAKLDYIKDMGFKGIWLMPINPSPSYHGYDINDYYNINPDYGTLEDYKELIKEAHKRDIMVVMDLVINHTSIEHPWFKEASGNKKSQYRDYYLWSSDSAVENESSPISSQPWTKLGDEYYYSIFWSGMPDLNYDNDDVKNEMKKVAKFYLDIGVDGFRLDAAKWIFNDDNKNVVWWKEFNSYVKSINKDAVLVGEVWDKKDVISNYEGALDSCFNFPASEAVVGDVSNSFISLLGDKLSDIYETYDEKDKNFIDSPFLTNHDMDRSMNRFNEDLDMAKTAAAILLTLPGTPYVYYGEEIGMTGTKPDEKIRQPFIWDNTDESKNSAWEPTDNDINKIAVSVEEKDKNSLLNFYKTMINLRNNNDVLRYGNFQSVTTKNEGTMIFKREYNDKSVYVCVNMDKKQSEEQVKAFLGKVLYSNSRKTKRITSKNSIVLQPGEILIFQK